MSVIDLTRRITYDWDDYNKNIKSHESCIFIEVDGNESVVIQSGTSVNLTVGAIWYDSEKHTNNNIPKNGVQVKPKKYIVVQTQQRFAIPHNVYGILVGKGNNIFNGGVISTGKITPGFKGELKIGYYNAGESTIRLKKGDLLACCIFLDTETTIMSEELDDQDQKPPAIEFIKRRTKLKEYLKNNLYSILSVIISIAAVIVALLN